MMQKQFVTKQKHTELTETLHTLKTVKRKDIAEKLDYARSLGDLSENAEYHEARETQSSLETEIATIEAILINAEVVTHKKTSTVTVGSMVTLLKKGSVKEITYEIVGSAEANMLEHKLSSESPLGLLLLDKKVEDIVTLTIPTGEVQYTVKKLA